MKLKGIQWLGTVIVTGVPFVEVCPQPAKGHFGLASYDGDSSRDCAHQDGVCKANGEYRNPRDMYLFNCPQRRDEEDAAFLLVTPVPLVLTTPSTMNHHSRSADSCHEKLSPRYLQAMLDMWRLSVFVVRQIQSDPSKQQAGISFEKQGDFPVFPQSQQNTVSLPVRFLVGACTLKFVEIRSNKKWERSDKVAEVFYASKFAYFWNRCFWN